MKGELQLEPMGETNPSDSDPLLENLSAPVPESMDEIRDEDVESASAACCRICLEYDAEPGQFVLPAFGAIGLNL